MLPQPVEIAREIAGDREQQRGEQDAGKQPRPAPPPAADRRFCPAAPNGPAARQRLRQRCERGLR